MDAGKGPVAPPVADEMPRLEGRRLLSLVVLTVTASLYMVSVNVRLGRNMIGSSLTGPRGSISSALYPVVNCHGAATTEDKLEQLLRSIFRNVSAEFPTYHTSEINRIIQHVMSRDALTLRTAGLNPNYCTSWNISSSSSSSQDKTTRILIWTPGVFKRIRIQRWEAALDAGVCHGGGGSHGNTCVLTEDRNLLRDSDVVLAHLNGPGEMRMFPATRPSKQIWVIYDHESPLYSSSTSEEISVLQPYFNYSAYYSTRADINMQYGECRPLASLALEWPTSDLSIRGFPDAMRFWTNQNVNFAASKQKLILWLVSNCRPPSQRQTYAALLGKYVDIDIVGRCGRELGEQCESQFTCANEVNKYKFYLAFENSLCENYVTEKPFKALLPGTYSVPIVLGHANYEALLPPHSYIDVRNFSSPKKLASHLKYLDTHDDAYNEYFEWRKYYACQLVPHPSRLCDAVHDLLGRAEHSANLSLVFGPSENCISPREFYKDKILG